MNLVCFVAKLAAILSVGGLRLVRDSILTLDIDLTYAPGVNISTAPYQCSYNLRMSDFLA